MKLRTGQWFHKLIALLMFFALAACAGEDKPFSLVGDSNDGGADPSTNNPGGGETPGGQEGCFVNFNGQMQLKISAAPSGGAPLEKLDAKPVVLQPIPIKADGNTLTLAGDTFPQIILTTVNDTVDLRISGIPGTSASGTYDPATGAIEISDFQFALEILNKGTTTPFVDGKETLAGVDFTTGSVTANGNNNPITETGSPVDPTTKAMAMVIGITLPEHFTALNLLDTRIGGGALTANFSGTLDQLPDQCTGGTPGGGTPGGGGTAPGEFGVSDGVTPKLTAIDFGNTPVIVKAFNGKQILDCTDALNRGILTKTLTVTNTGEGERKFAFMRATDNDGDTKDPLCSGEAEFVRGSITASGGATCTTVKVAGKDYNTDECTIPAGSPDAKLVFPVMYAPFNFIQAPEGGTQASDSGNLTFQYDDNKTFSISLKGKSEPDTRDVFSVSKVKDGVVSPKQIKNKGLIKVALQTGDPKPFTQKLALLNAGTDSWEEIKMEVLGDEPAFSVTALPATTLAGSDGVSPSQLEFDLVFSPGSEASYNNTLQISLLKAGSKTADNPSGDVTTLLYTLSGTVGIPTLSGDVKFQVDFLAGKIDHSVTVDPVESLDFRDHTDEAPPPLPLIFADTTTDGVKAVTLNVENKDVLEKSLNERKTSLRILNAQATVGKNGQKLIPGQGSDLCNEPPNIKQPYNDSSGECSYFYFNIFGEEPGIYDDDSGELTLPDITLRIQNPYHSDIVGKWPKSAYGSDPDYMLDTTLQVTLTTHTMDQAEIEELGTVIDMLPDPRLSASDLNVKGKKLGKDCVEDYLNHNPSEGTLAEKHPHLLCYVTSDQRNMQGLPANLRPESTTEYDVVLVGVGRYPPGGPNTSNPSLPWFMGEEGGSKMYVAIQGRLYKE